MAMAVGMERGVPGSPQKEPTELRTLKGKAQRCRRASRWQGHREREPRGCVVWGEEEVTSAGLFTCPKQHHFHSVRTFPSERVAFNDPEKNHESMSSIGK